MASMQLTLQDVSIDFGDGPLLRKVNLAIPKGESLVLIGPSGFGKSVVLKLFAGLLKPDSGKVYICEKDFQTLSHGEQLKLQLRMGMLFQKNALFDSLTVSENVAFPMRETTHLSEGEIQDRVSFFLEEVGLEHAANLYPDEISGGMQKRLGIARALALKPEIVLYDDPTAGLDPITSRRIIDLILKLRQESRSTLVSVTNDMARAYQLADRIAMVVDGEILVTGTKSETLANRDPRVIQFIHGRLEGPLTREFS